MPEVSIGMPVFNDRIFLTKAIESLLGQSFTDFELIISDDASTDGSQEVCLYYSKIDSRIKYIRQEANIGISSNMEFLLAQAKGTYFMWAGNDDYWHQDYIKSLVNCHKMNPNLVVAFTPMVFVDENDLIIKDYGVRSVSYEASTPVERLSKLINFFDDAFGYALFKREKIIGVEFPIWWWINSKCAYNNIYPSLCFYLSKGNFKLCDSQPMWFNRLKQNHNVNHKIPYNNSFIRGLFAFVLRKFNLVIVSLKQIYRGSRNIYLPVRMAPLMLYKWFIYPSYVELKNRLKLYLSHKISFF